MTKQETILLDLASNGRADTYPSLTSSSSRALQVAQLQAPHLHDVDYDLDAPRAPTHDLFGSIEPHIKMNHTKTPVSRSK
ncbi:hypothetical protein BGZ98_001556, partial [Dissophora globulifera]